MACLSYIKTDYEREKLVYKADPSDVSFLHDGICGFGRNCLQLCEVGFRIDGFRSEYLSFFSVLLVSDLSVLTGMLMNKIGRKKTVMLSLVVTFVSLLIPCFGDGYMVMLVSFFFIRDRECFDADLSEPASL